MIIVRTSTNPNELQHKKRLGKQELAKQHEVQRFLTKLSYAQPKEGEFGITWLELYTLYKAMGHDCPVSDPEAKAKARPSMGAQIKAFQEEDKQALACESFLIPPSSEKPGRAWFSGLSGMEPASDLTTKLSSFTQPRWVPCHA